MTWDSLIKFVIEIKASFKKTVKSFNQHKVSIYYTIILLFLLLPFAVNAKQKDTCLTGLYLKNIFDLHPEEYAYTADFWIWFNHKHPSFDPLQNVEIINAKQVTFSDLYHANAGVNMLVASESCKVTLIHNWKLENYPFDRQSLHIELEAGLDTSKMILQPIIENFKIYKGIILPGWNILSSNDMASLVTYESDFGDRLLHGKSTFSRITYTVNIKRNGWGVFFKLVLGLYIAFFVSFLVFFIPPANEQRFGLSIGALFAAVANKYISDNNIPTSISFSFVDQVHVLTFTFILAMLVLSLLSMKIIEVKGHKKRKSFDRTCAIVTLSTYVLINALLIIKANIG